VPLLGIVASLGHTVLASIWLGAMTYSLLVVQPRAAALLGQRRYEEFAAVIAAGARWSVLAVCAGLALTGVALAALRTGESTSWWVVVAAKVALLTAALAIFGWVSWRLWPRRIFALPEEVPAVLRSFRIAATTLLALVAAQFVLGAVAAELSGNVSP
jgi:hypothetical protein